MDDVLFIELPDLAGSHLTQLLHRATKLLDAHVDRSLRSGVVDFEGDGIGIVIADRALNGIGDIRIDDWFQAIEQFTVGVRDDALEVARRVGDIFCGPHQEPDLVFFDGHGVGLFVPDCDFVVFS